MVAAKLMTPSEAARLLGVSPVTIRKWASKGVLPSHNTVGGHRRYDYQELAQFAQRHNMTLFQPDADGLRILIVEDDPQFADFVSAALETLQPKPQMELAYDGFEAGWRVQQFRPDLVLLDLMLPGVDGFAICRRLRNTPETRHIRILTMTGYATPGNIERILNSGAEACLCKPFSAAELLAAVREKVVSGRLQPRV